jgi:hypothetical protein
MRFDQFGKTRWPDHSFALVSAKVTFHVGQLSLVTV